jgi:hypothetical protein
MVTQTETINGNVLALTMDKRTQELFLDLENKCALTEMENAQRLAEAQAAEAARLAEAKNKSTAEICRDNPQLLGYKIQLAVVKSKKEADELGLEFRRKFPTMKVEIDASLRPDYKVLAGSYFSRESASGDLRRIRTEFDQARAVQYRIFCAEAK